MLCFLSRFSLSNSPLKERKPQYPKGRGLVSIKHILPVSTPSRMVFLPIWLILPCFGVFMSPFDLIFRVVRRRWDTGASRVMKGQVLVSTEDFLEKAIEKINNTARINTPKGHGRVSTTVHVLLKKSYNVSIPRRVGACFHVPVIVYETVVETVYQYPEGSSTRFYWTMGFSSLLTKICSSINTPKGRALVSTATYCPLYHTFFYPHILPFFHLRASQKNKFRRRCSHFSFLLPPYLDYSITSIPIYGGS